MAKIRLLNNLTGEYIEYDESETKADDMPAVEPQLSVDDLQKRIATLESELAKVKATAEEAKATSEAASAAVAKAAAGAEMK